VTAPNATIDSRLHAIATAQPYPLLFATVSGAHLYGFPSPDSDWDLRGVHILPAREVVGLKPVSDTLTITEMRDDLELDLVTHDVKKFFGLMLRRNGYVLEQLWSPLVVTTTPAHAELKAIARGCVTRHHNHHYLGFAATQWDLFAKESPRRVKPLLYVYRVLLSGIHLLRTGEVNANLLECNEDMRLPYLDDLVARKTGGPEKGAINGVDFAFHRAEFDRLLAVLEESAAASPLPEGPTSRPALEDLLLRVRLKGRAA